MNAIKHLKELHKKHLSSDDLHVLPQPHPQSFTELTVFSVVILKIIKSFGMCTSPDFQYLMTHSWREFSSSECYHLSYRKRDS